MSDAGMSLRGRNGIFSLVAECLDRPPGTERPVTMLLGPPGSGASEAHHVLTEKFGVRTPWAYVNFHSGQALLPRYALALLAHQLERQWQQYRQLRFPRLTLALLASDNDLRMAGRVEGRRAIQAQLDQFRQRVERQHGDYFGAFLAVAGGAMGLPGGIPEVVAAAVRDAVGRGGRWLPGKRISDETSQWFADHPLIRIQNGWDALMTLNMWRHSGSEDQKRTLDRVLFDAFLTDLSSNAQRWFAARSFLILLDNCHTGRGRQFLDLLIRSRHDAVVRGTPCDPLTVVGSANRWLDEWGAPSGDQWVWQLRSPDRASLSDWREHRPGHDSDDSWWYPLRLRDLNFGEVGTRVEQATPRHSDLAPFVHRLTNGLPKAVEQVTDTLDSADAPRGAGPQRDQWLRALPQHRLRSRSTGPRGVPDRPRPLHEAALDHLLAGLPDEQRRVLTLCAAARDLSVGCRVFGVSAREGVGESLFNEVRARWLLHSTARLAPALHPWPRRLLLWRLAQDGDTWNSAHQRLSEHFEAEGRTVDRLYHLLAVHRIPDRAAGDTRVPGRSAADESRAEDRRAGRVSGGAAGEAPELAEVVQYLTGAFRSMAAPRWISELNVITSAPNRLPADRTPMDLLADLAPDQPGETMTTASMIRSLVLARWVWIDPLGDPGMRLNDVIADRYTMLAGLRGTDIVALFDEAGRYRHWRHPLTGEEGW